MAGFEETRDRLREIEDRAEAEPGEALEELESVIRSLDEMLEYRHGQAAALLRNEDFVGAAHLLGQNAMLLQWASNLTTTLRTQTHRLR